MNETGSRHLRIIIADDNQEILDWLRRTLAPAFDVVAAVSNGESALAAVARLSPDVLVSDISMPGMNGFELARKLAQSGSPCRILFLTVQAEPAYLSEALRSGVAGYVLKMSAGSELSAAIQAVARGELYVSSPLTLPER